MYTLTRFDLQYSLENFKRDFPNFQWEIDIRKEIKQYIDLAVRRGEFDTELEYSFEDKIIDENK